MDEMEQAHHELGRIQTIIDRHEGHMFSLRGWLFAALAGIVAAYYTNTLTMSVVEFTVVVAGMALVFIYAELRHVMLVDAVVRRSGELEEMIAAARRRGDESTGWYDGPKVSEVCRKAVRRMVPSFDMTLLQNLFFYCAIAAAVIALVILLPRRP